MRWAGPVFVLLLAATSPLLAPASARDVGWLPDVAVLAAVFLGFRATPDRAAVFGALAGALASLWSAEPAFLRAFVLGAVGYGAGQAAVVFHRDATAARMAVAAGGVLLLRLAEHVAAALGGGGAGWSGSDAAFAVRNAVLSAAVAAAVAPSWFGLVRGLRLLAPLERSFRDV